MVEGSRIRPVRDLTKAPAVELASEGGVPHPFLGLALREVQGQHSTGQLIRAEDDEGSAVGKPGDGVVDLGIGEEGVHPHGEFAIPRHGGARSGGRGG